MRSDSLDLTKGNLFKKIVLFALPVVLTSLLQLVYNTADLLVVSNFGGGVPSMTAVGDNWSIINIVINTFVMIGVGVNVVVADAFGKKDDDLASKSIGSSVLLSFIIGIPLGLLGFFLSPALEAIMNTPSDILDMATLYLRVYMLGVPFLVLYNFLTSALRGLGDSKSPLLILLFCGLANVGMNFFFVYLFYNVFHITSGDILGVALATVLCEFFEALSTFIVLLRRKKKAEIGGISFKDIHLHKRESIAILKHGLPSGLECFIFGLSNAAIQAQANLLGTVVISADTASGNIEGYIFAALEAFITAEVAIVAQNYGAGDKQRVKKSFLYSLLIIVILAVSMGGVAIASARPLIGIYIADTAENAATMEIAINHLIMMCATYALCAFMDAGSGYLRGTKHAFAPTIAIFMTACVFRLSYVYFFYRPFIAPTDLSLTAKDLILFGGYPACWTLSCLIYLVMVPIFMKKDGVIAKANHVD